MSKRKYQTEEERLEARRELQRIYHQKHKAEISERHRKYYTENPEKFKVYRKRLKEQRSTDEGREQYNAYSREFYKKPSIRSNHLVNGYLHFDQKFGRETTITREWIMDRIFSSSCVYCGESDWHKLGCDRKDNSIGHTPENCVPCCLDCNRKRNRKGFSQFIGSQWGLWGRLNQSGSARTQYAVRLPLSARRELEAEGRL